MALAVPELPAIPNTGQSGQDVTLPDVVAEHYPPSLPSSLSSEIPGPPFEVPVGPPDGVPPDPVTPAHGEHPLGGAPPFDLGPSVPEPATYLLMATGIVGLLIAGRRHRA